MCDVKASAKLSKRLQQLRESSVKPISGQILHKRKELNFLQKIHTRELTGAVRNGFCTRDPTVRLFTRLPGRLAFCLKDAIPQSAFELGHIFLGFSKCGQFLLSYTQTTADIDLGIDVMHIRYTYRLHWWLFVPYRRAKKVSEVILFANGGCPGNLRLVCASWPDDMKKIIIFGHQILDGSEDESNSSSRCYITVTAVPSLNACKECNKVDKVLIHCFPREMLNFVANNYEEDEMAAAWNSCVRLSCLEHGMTVHTNFDLVPPYPKFEPKISLKRNGSVLVNSGNFLYFIDVRLEKLSCDDDSDQRGKSRLFSSAAQGDDDDFSSFQSELNLPFGSSVFFSPSYQANSDSETDVEPRKTRFSVITNPERLQKVAEFTGRLRQPFQQLVAHRLNNLDNDEPNVNPAESSRKQMAEKAYELTDDDFNEEGGVKEKLSTFRRKRLADKKYEFTEEDSESSPPLPKLRNSSSSIGDLPSGDQMEALSLSEIELSGMMPAVPELLSPGGMVKKDQSLSSPRSQSSYDGCMADRPLRIISKFTRRFIADDESASVITDVDADDDGHVVSSGGCPPLNLEVHGSGYQSMSMVSNAKAGRMSGRCVKVTQHSIDIEFLCHDMAQKMCQAASMKYWYCIDYDVEIIDLDPNSGEVICVAVILVMATVLTKTVSQHNTYSISSLKRNQHQACFKFCWNIDTGEYNVVDSEPLTEPLKDNRGCGNVWHPARSIAAGLQKSWGVMGTGHCNIRCFTNDSVISGTSLKTIVDSDHLVAIILDDLD